MNKADAPKKQPVPFGINGQREDLLSTTPAGDNTASYDAGFPAITMILKAAGGLPPKGQDMNQILFELSSIARWFSAGAGNQFDSAFSSSIAGYPAGASIACSDGRGYWLNTVDANTTNPENTTSAITGWVPGVQYGTTSITGLSGSSVTLTTLQAAKSTITIAGTLTSNINLNFPAWQKSWTVINNCTGAFTVTCKTVSGSGIPIASGVTAKIICDGVNIKKDFGTAALVDVGTGAGQIPDMSSFVSSQSATPYQKLPSGLIIQAGSGTIPTSGTGIISFPVSFTSATASLVVSPTSISPSNYIITTGAITASGATIYGTAAMAGSVPNTGSTVGYRFVAFGY